MQQYTEFDLGEIFHGHMLLINISLSIVSLLSLNSYQENCIIAQCILTEAEMRVLLPLLDAPACCQQEVLQAGCCCTYEFLLQALLSPDEKTSTQWSKLVQEQRDRLQLASVKKAKRDEMKGVYNALFGLRQKLEPLGLTVRSRRDGYYNGIGGRIIAGCLNEGGEIGYLPFLCVLHFPSRLLRGWDSYL